MFAKRSVGLDISDYSIEVVEVTGRAKQAKVKAVGRVELPFGVVERGVVMDEDKFISAVKEVFKTAEPKPIKPVGVAVSVPDAQVYLKTTSLTEETAKKEEDIAVGVANRELPLLPENRTLSFLINKLPDASKNILLVAAETTYLEHMVSVLQKAGVEVSHFEPIQLANLRAVFKEWPTGPVCVVDMGAYVSTVTSFASTGVICNQNIPIGAEVVEKDMQAYCDLTLQEAREHMDSVGIDDPTSRVTACLIRSVAPLVLEIKHALARSSEIKGFPVEKLVLLGGLGHMKGMAEYIATNIEVPVAVGVTDPAFSKSILSLLKKHEPPEGYDRLFIGAFGLASKALHSEYKEHPVLKVPGEK